MIYCVLWEGSVNSQHSRSPRDSGEAAGSISAQLLLRRELSNLTPKVLTTGIGAMEAEPCSPRQELSHCCC